MRPVRQGECRTGQRRGEDPPEEHLTRLTPESPAAPPPPPHNRCGGHEPATSAAAAAARWPSLPPVSEGRRAGWTSDEYLMLPIPGRSLGAGRAGQGGGEQQSRHRRRRRRGAVKVVPTRLAELMTGQPDTLTDAARAATARSREWSFPACLGYAVDCRARLHERTKTFERINPVSETNDSFDSCKRLGYSCLHELHGSKVKTYVCFDYRSYVGTS